MKISPHTRLASLGVVLALLQASYADLISIPPGNVSSSSEIGAPFNRQDDFIVDGSGLVGDQHTPAVESNMWLSTGTGFGGDDLDPFVIFDLGAVYTITSIHVWNYNESPPNLTNRGVNAVSIEYGTTAALGSTLDGIASFAQADGTATYAGDVSDAFAPFTARFIKFDIDSNHGDGNNFYGLSEVQFDGIPGGAGIVVIPSSFSTTATQGDSVGALSTPGGDGGDTFTYTLIAGAGDTDNAKFQIVGDGLQIGAHDFSGAPDGQEYSIRVLSTGAPSGTMVEGDLILSAVAPDLDAPMITELSPATGSDTAKVGDSLIVTFDEAIAIGTGDITIKNLSDSTETVIPVGDAQVTVTGTELTVVLSTNLLADKSYAVQIEATAIEDLAGNNFAGIIDDGTWNFSIPSTPPTTLVGYWPFDADTDPQPDQSGFENHATVFAGATWVDDSERNGAMEFDGNDAFLEAADSESLSLTDDLTIAAWINVTDFTGFRGIVGKTAGPAGNLPASYDLYLVANDGRARLYAGSPGGFNNVTATTVPGTGEWHHIAVTKVDTQISFYYDGVLDGQGDIPAELLDSDATLRIGNRTDLVTDFFGRMDDVAIFDGGLSADQVGTIMNGDFSEFGGSGGIDFRITSISKGQTLVGDVLVPSVTLTFNSLPGKKYKIEASTSLNEAETPGGWIELDDTYDSQGDSTIYVDTQFAGAGPRVYYRVVEN